MTIRLLGRTEIRHLAKSIDFRPRKSFGQNFVHDANTVRRIVSASGVNRSDHVLEVGPGLGSLTLALLDRGARVTAVEIDWCEDVKGFNSTKERNGDNTIAWIVQNKIDICIQSYPGGEGFKWLYPYLNCESIRRAPKKIKDVQHEVDVNLEMVKDLVDQDCGSLYSIPHYKIDVVDNLFDSYKDKIKVILCPNYKKDGVDIKKHWGIVNYARLINLRLMSIILHTTGVES